MTALCRAFALLGSLLIAGLFFCPTSVLAQEKSPYLNTVLYGASYYQEYMPYERLEQDVQMMEEAGITVLRLGESVWGCFEPQDGVFDFAWMDRIINRLHKANIKVILGTPTYSIPAWLYYKHPEILVTRLGQVHGYYGPRQNMDITHPTFLFYAERIIRKLLEHYKDHPAIIGYQVDNETSSYGTAGPNVQKEFVQYLKNKFTSVDVLNKNWGLSYWGQALHDWNEVPPRDNILNPGYKLEWERFQQLITTRYLAWQAAMVNEYKRPDQFVIHNFVGGARTDIDEFEIAKNLDLTGVNPYHEVQNKLDGQAIAFSGDMCRSLKRQNYLITETNAQTTGWDSKWQRPPYDGQLRLNVYSHISSGANAIMYWHWHSLHYGQETYWKGVLGHDLEPNRTYAEVCRIGKELHRLGPRLANFKPSSPVALLYSIDSYHGIEFMPFSDKLGYKSIFSQFHKQLFKANVGVDILFPQSKVDFSQYKVIIAPLLYVADDALLKKLADYVHNGGHLITTFKSGFCDEYSTVRWQRMPGLWRKAAGISYQEFSSLEVELMLKEDPYGVGEKNKVSTWAEFLELEGAQALAWYDHPFFGKYPAITCNTFGKGSLTYEGTVLTEELQLKVVQNVLKLAGLNPEDNLPAPVRKKSGLSNAGRPMLYYLNYSSDRQSFYYSGRPALELLSNQKVSTGQRIELPPWDLVILEEL
jgi:beta-galactosidase